MGKNVKIGNLSVGPGEKKYGAVEVGMGPSGTKLEFPIYIVNGVKEGPKLLTTSGTHGDETESILATASLAQQINPQKLSGTFIGIPVLNIPAYELRTRGVPMWGAQVTDLNRNFDMNRMHPSLGGVTTAIASTYWNEVVTKVDYSIAHHGGPGNCYLQQRVIASSDFSETMELAKALGGEWDIIQVGAPRIGSLNYACDAENIPCITTEHGGGGGRHPNIIFNSVNKIASGVLNVMKHLGMLPEKPEYIKKWRLIKRDDRFPKHGGLSIPEQPAIDSLNSRELLKKGTSLMKIINLFGEEVERIEAPSDGIVIGLKTDPVTHPWDKVLWFGEVIETITS